MRPPPLTLARIPVGRHTVVGSDMVPVLARDKMTWEEEEGGGDAMWPILPPTTALNLARPYKGKKKMCCSVWFLCFLPVLLCIMVNFPASNQTSLPFSMQRGPYLLTPCRPRLDHKNIPLLLAWCMPGIASIENKKTQIQEDNFEWRTEGSGQGDGVQWQYGKGISVNLTQLTVVCYVRG